MIQRAVAAGEASLLGELFVAGVYGAESGAPAGPAPNVLVHGESSAVLRTLRPRLEGAVKLVYLDPPYNTGASFEHYDDALSPPAWRRMMGEILDLLAPLLADDGSLWCEIDDTELGQLQVLLDDRFGRRNRITTVTIRRSAVTGHKAINPGPVNVADYLFGYARDRSRWRYRHELVPRPGYDTQYNRYVAGRDRPFGEWRLEPLAPLVASRHGFRDARAARAELGTASFADALSAFALAHAESVARLALVNYAAVSRAARAAVDASRESETVHCLRRPAHSDLYLYKGQRILFLADKVRTNATGRRELVEKLTNIWDDIGFQGIAGEGGVGFAKAKKPERLLRRIIALASDPGDLVLDCFAGSGTTGAVAHKMGRRWVLVEAGPHAETIALPRLRRVVAGEDPTGVTKLEGFKGGGSFSYLTTHQTARGGPFDTHEDMTTDPRHPTGGSLQAGGSPDRRVEVHAAETSP
ncbi:MAG TPA: site-specific DNA-methyltransferase [Acidimicrobiales bacterium]|nr:site-specific DNA-methyltransferase [Acidimicrobiales bacterium]